MDPEGYQIKILKDILPQLIEAKMKEGVTLELVTRKLMTKRMFRESFNEPNADARMV